MAIKAFFDYCPCSQVMQSIELLHRDADDWLSLHELKERQNTDGNARKVEVIAEGYDDLLKFAGATVKLTVQYEPTRHIGDRYILMLERELPNHLYSPSLVKTAQARMEFLANGWAKRHGVSIIKTEDPTWIYRFTRRSLAGFCELSYRFHAEGTLIPSESQALTSLHRLFEG